MTIPFQSTIIYAAIEYLLNDANKKELVNELVEKIDEISEKQLGKKSEKVQLDFIEKILIPLAKELSRDGTKEERHRYIGIIAKEFSRADRKLREDSQRVDSEFR